MGAGLKLAVTEKRRATRHPVDFQAIAEHRQLGDVRLHVVNLSDHGFMSQGDLPPFSRGERVTVRLPVIGQIEAHLIWTVTDRAGFQFERIIRNDEFVKTVAAMQPNPRLRPVR